MEQKKDLNGVTNWNSADIQLMNPSSFNDLQQIFLIERRVGT